MEVDDHNLNEVKQIFWKWFYVELLYKESPGQPSGIKLSLLSGEMQQDVSDSGKRFDLKMDRRILGPAMLRFLSKLPPVARYFIPHPTLFIYSPYFCVPTHSIYAFLSKLPKGKSTVVSVLNQVTHHKDILCLIKHHSMYTYGGLRYSSKNS
jgi:hypothetical protein